MTTWLELSKLPEGTRLRFTEAYDIFPECVVPGGALCTLKENGLNEIWCSALLLPDDGEIRAALSEWKGCIYMPGWDLDPAGPHADPRWHDESPLEVAS